MCLRNHIVFVGFWWARPDLNQRPPGYEPGALTKLSYGPHKFSHYPIVKLRFKHFLFYSVKRKWLVVFSVIFVYWDLQGTPCFGLRLSTDELNLRVVNNHSFFFICSVIICTMWGTFSMLSFSISIRGAFISKSKVTFTCPFFSSAI